VDEKDRLQISLLMDFYSSLLTDKQNDVMQLYYNDDLSLGEIAELNKISRQAIHDLIKRCYKQLLSYESKLNLLQKSTERKKQLMDFLELVKEDYAVNEKDIKKYKDILENL